MSPQKADVIAAVAPVLREAFLGAFGDRLVSLVLFGSVARGEARKDSDIDVIVVADDLPRTHRVRFDLMYPAIQAAREGLRIPGLFEYPDLSPLLYSREEAARHCRLYLDVAWDGILLFDRDGFLDTVFAGVRRRMQELGSRRVLVGRKWYWDLKPDYRPGEVFDL